MEKVFTFLNDNPPKVWREKYGVVNFSIPFVYQFSVPVSGRKIGQEGMDKLVKEASLYLKMQMNRYQSIKNFKEVGSELKLFYDGEMGSFRLEGKIQYKLKLLDSIKLFFSGVEKRIAYFEKVALSLCDVTDFTGFSRRLALVCAS
jgi:hypothetical protein